MKGAKSMRETQLSAKRQRRTVAALQWMRFGRHGGVRRAVIGRGKQQPNYQRSMPKAWRKPEPALTKQYLQRCDALHILVPHISLRSIRGYLKRNRREAVYNRQRANGLLSWLNRIELGPGPGSPTMPEAWLYKVGQSRCVQNY